MCDEPDTVILTDIQQKGRQYLLRFSDGYEIRATGRVIEQLHLAEGMRFTHKTFHELKKILEWELAVYTAEAMLARRPYSIGEFKQRLRHKDISGDHIAKIVRDFRDKGFLDDYAYARARAQSLVDRKPVGKGYLVAWLQKRLVPRQIAEKAVGELLSGVDEIATAVELLRRKRAAFAKFDLETARRKAYTYLSRRAISYGAAKAAFEKVFGQSAE